VPIDRMAAEQRAIPAHNVLPGGPQVPTLHAAV
jgi:hypothetical protein